MRRKVTVGNGLSQPQCPGADADHALVILSSAATGGGHVNDSWHDHAARGVDIWRVDPVPDDGVDEWAHESVAVSEYIAGSTGLPVFVHGSSAGAVAAYRVLQGSDLCWGAVLLVDATIAARLTAFSSDPDIPLAQNTKPILYVVAEPDPAVGATAAKTIAAATAGPVEVQVQPEDAEQLTVSRFPAYSDIVLEWCLRQVTNHFHAGWQHG
jgi:hypothetical protein